MVAPWKQLREFSLIIIIFRFGKVENLHGIKFLIRENASAAHGVAWNAARPLCGAFAKSIEALRPPRGFFFDSV
jgi:hypothetical protein